MGLIKAGKNYLLGIISNAIYNHDVKSAPNISFKQTGNEMEYSKQRGHRLNGSTTYKKNLARNLDKAKQRKALRDKFISDL